MAAVTLGVQTASTSDTTSYTSASFTPAAGDVLICFVVASNTMHGNWSGGTGSVVDSLGGVWDFITARTNTSNAHSCAAYLRRGLAAASAMTVTFDCTGDPATGAVIAVYRVSSADPYVRQFGSGANVAATTPSVVMPQAINTNNPCVATLGTNINPNTILDPSGWALNTQAGYATPGFSQSVTFRDSGETASTITWGSVSSNLHMEIVVELYASGQGPEVVADHSGDTGFFGVMGAR